MASKLIQFRLSGEELEALEVQVKEGDSINLVAQRILIGALGVDRSVDSVSTPDLDERIESVVEDKLSSFAVNMNDLLSRLQERIQALETQVATLSTDNQPDLAPAVDTPVDSVDSDVDESLTGKELAERLGVDPGTLTKNRSKPTFADWTRDKDPEGTAWQYLSKVKRYSRLLSTEMSTPASTTESDHLAGWKAKVDEVVGAL